MRTRIVLAFFWLTLSGCAALPEPPRYSVRATPMPDWEAVFRPANSSFRGADAYYSVALSSSETLWLFGDTWVTAPAAKGREGARMIRNSLAIQRLESASPVAPNFFWRHDKKGTAEGNDSKPLDFASDAFVPASGPGWLWPLAGVRVEDELALFMSQLIASEKGLGFEGQNNILLLVRNPDEPPIDWRIDQYPIPFYRHTANGDRVFGCAAIADPKSSDVFIYGVREDWGRGFSGRDLILARAPAGALRAGDFSSWKFFDGSGWASSADEAHELFSGTASEMSVSYLPGLGRYVAVYSAFGLSPEILARFAEEPEGPWSEPLLLYTCPDIQWSEKYFCYAAKAHPELATSPNELVITYACNSSEFGDHFRDADRLYWPRFIRVTLTEMSE
jgi:hypothetical protein